MTKIEELLCEKFGLDFENFYDEEYGIADAISREYHKTTDLHRIVSVIKEYAEEYALEYRKKLEEACVGSKIIYSKGEIVEEVMLFNKTKYHNTELPSHD